jgi:hypothetical protein
MIGPEMGVRGILRAKVGNYGLFPLEVDQQLPKCVGAAADVKQRFLGERSENIDRMGLGAGVNHRSVMIFYSYLPLGCVQFREGGCGGQGALRWGSLCILGCAAEIAVGWYDALEMFQETQPIPPSPQSRHTANKKECVTLPMPQPRLRPHAPSNSSRNGSSSPIENDKHSVAACSGEAAVAE